MGVLSILIVNGYKQLKIKKETHEKLKQLQRFYGIKYERDVHFSEILEELMIHGFKQFDDKIIKQVKNN